MKVLESQEKLTEEQVAIVFTKWQNIESLTKREKEILKFMLLGYKRKEIASKLFIADSSVKNHTTNLFKKLNIENKDQLFENARNNI